MLNEIEKALNESFKELFEKNYSWLLYIVLIHLIIFIVYIIIQFVIHHKTDDSSNEEVLELRKEIQSLKFKLEYITKNHNILKDSLDNFKKEHQTTSLKEINSKLDHIENFLNSDK